MSENGMTRPRSLRLRPDATPPHFDHDGIVIDPEVPEDARGYLTGLATGDYPAPYAFHTPLSELRAALNDGKPAARDLPRRPSAKDLIPYRKAPPARKAPPEPGDLSATYAAMWRRGLGSVACAIAAGFAGSWNLGALMAALILLSVVLGTMWLAGLAKALLIIERRALLRRWHIENIPSIFHRRYVVPRTDIAGEGTQAWRRAIAAANKISQSDVVNQRLVSVDPEQVATVMPHRLWEIAERLAKLSQATDAHRQALGDIDPSHRDVAATVAQQRHIQNLAYADITKRVVSLEAIAAKVTEADDAKRREAAAIRLAKINPLHAGLLDGHGVTIGDPGIADRLGDDVQAVIEQSRRAIQEANEAAMSLILPDEA
jgi:hypothetical protein